MTAKSKADIYKFIYISLTLLLLVQLVDFLVQDNLRFSLNQQLFFGLMGDNLIAYAIAIPVLTIIIYLFVKKIIGIEACLIATGLISNIFDRIFYGGVVDYFSIFFIPKFNLADILIIAGSLILVYKIIKTI